VTIRGPRFVIREGGLRGRRTVIILSGPGRDKAAQATETLIDGHRPHRVVSAGFAGALCAELNRNDILIADRILGVEGGEIRVDVPPGLAETLQQRGVYRGSLLTTDRVVRLPREKRAMFQRFGSMAVDMETLAVAEVCLRRKVPFSSVRVINDTADQVLPRDVEHLLTQKTPAAQLGAALGAIWRRPASAKDMYVLRENALVASGRLAKFLMQAEIE
jgi:adenosylhomocysteine nucleosidase